MKQSIKSALVGAGVVLVIMVLNSSLATRSLNAAPDNAGQHYKILSVKNSDNVEATLNDLARVGWRLVATAPDDNSSTKYILAK